jgi:hypothetical protein
VVVPPRVAAAPSKAAQSPRDRHLQTIARHDPLAWQKQSGYVKRARTEAAMSRSKQVIGDDLNARTDQCRATKVAVVVHALNRISELGRPNYVRLG